MMRSLASLCEYVQAACLPASVGCSKTAAEPTHVPVKLVFKLFVHVILCEPAPGVSVVGTPPMHAKLVFKLQTKLSCICVLISDLLTSFS